VTISEPTQGGYSQMHLKCLGGPFPAQYGAFISLGPNLIKLFSVSDTIPSKSDWFLLKINWFFFWDLARTMLLNGIFVSC
jgi:hypothetical protein